MQRFYRRQVHAGRAFRTLALVFMALATSSGLAPPSEPPAARTTHGAIGERMRGITLGMIEDNRYTIKGYGTPGSRWALEEIASLGANWTSITPYATMISRDDVAIVPYFEYPPDELERRVRATIRQAHDEGLSVLLIPHVYPWDWSWRGELNPGGGRGGTAVGWQRWFDSYERYMLGWAEVAEQEHVEMLSIGVELKTASWRHRDRFVVLAERIRERYGGLLVYSANWDEVEQVGFWHAVDVIGLNAFYPLSELDHPDPDDMMRNALAFGDTLEMLSGVYDKPVVFTEVGFKALADTYREPWIWPEDLGDVPADERMQALLFDVTFAAYWPRSWFGGLFVWKFLADPADDTQEPPFGFSPRLKPAQYVIESWFEHGPDPYDAAAFTRSSSR
jgi:hypothetical protein